MQDLRQLCSARSLSSDQQEIVALLNKLHTVQVENAQLQSSLVSQKCETRRRDFLLGWQRHHAGVARLLVHKQKALIEEHDVTLPPELHDLYDVYEKQFEESNKRSFLPPIDTTKVNNTNLFYYSV